MRKRPCLLLLLAVGVLSPGLFFVISREREPEYRGTRLSEWVDTIWKPMPKNTTDEVAYNIRRFDETPVAMRSMGTNALPYLLSSPQWLVG